MVLDSDAREAARHTTSGACVCTHDCSHGAVSPYLSSAYRLCSQHHCAQFLHSRVPLQHRARSNIYGTLQCCVQDRNHVIVYGGCNICSGDSLLEDVSGSDDHALAFFDFSATNFFDDVPEVVWSSARTRGFQSFPPRKGHAVTAHGCNDAHSAENKTLTLPSAALPGDAQQMPSCTLVAFGGWNPRWPANIDMWHALHKLDLDTMVWSQVPADHNLVRPLMLD